jgi:hypothetical protein
VWYVARAGMGYLSDWWAAKVWRSIVEWEIRLRTTAGHRIQTVCNIVKYRQTICMVRRSKSPPLERDRISFTV